MFNHFLLPHCYLIKLVNTILLHVHLDFLTTILRNFDAVEGNVQE